MSEGGDSFEVSGVEWGADQESILRLYKSLIRSKLDYGEIVYTSASPSTFKKLDPIAYEAMRLATGAFTSTSISSLQVLCGRCSLDLRKRVRNLEHCYKIRSLPYNLSF